LKIIGIVGIGNFFGADDMLWNHLRTACIEIMPDATFVIEHALYFPWQKDIIATFANDIVEKHDTGEDLILLGYSLGGIIACACAPRFTKSNIRVIATIGAPHRIGMFYRWLNAEATPLPMPVLSFTGILDPVVLSMLTRYPASIPIPIISDHLILFFLSTYPAKIVAKAISHQLGQDLLQNETNTVSVSEQPEVHVPTAQPLAH
jgi:pimeloyl-ACP methyl ester carboxylesterase